MHTVKALRRERFMARDGHAGALADVYFDDLGWEVRYLVIHTGWLGGDVLVAPAAVDRHRSTDAVVRLALSRREIKAAPSAETDLPVWRQRRLAEAVRFGYPYYWSGLAFPESIGASQADAERAAHAALARGDRHLRSVRALTGCRVLEGDGVLGTLEDFVIDERGWTVPKLLVDTRRWARRGRVEVSTVLVTRIDWEAREVGVSPAR